MLKILFRWLDAESNQTPGLAVSVEAELLENGIQVCREQEENFWIEQMENALFLCDCQEDISKILKVWRKRKHETNIPPVIGVEIDETAHLTGCRYVIKDANEADAFFLDYVYRRVHRLPWDILETERCVVRETKEEDIDAFYEIYAEPSITYYTEALFTEKEQEIEYLRKYQDVVYALYEFGVWTVVEKMTGKVIGRAGISMREEFEEPELGFVFDVKYQGKGYATEVCREIIAYMREIHGITTLQALTKKENAASLRLLARLGFKKQAGEVVVKGETYDRYLLLGTDYFVNGEKGKE